MLASPAQRYVPAGDLAVVTSYFNSHHYVSKRDAFRLFTESMERSGIPLFVGECAFGDDAFELPQSKTVFRFRGPDVLWQKERLLNLTIDRVPDRYTKIAWLDADVLFDNPLWAVDTSDQLDEVPVVQPFAQAIRLRPDTTTYDGDGERYRGFCYVHSVLPTFSGRGDFFLHGHSGFAWAADRNLLASLRLYDAAIAGGADHLMAHAFSGDFDSECLALSFQGCVRLAEHFRGWADSAWRSVRGRMGYVPGAALHLWHGESQRRRYLERYRDISSLGYDPTAHLTEEANGLWGWHSETAAALHDWSLRYFGGRAEDTLGATTA